MASYWLFKTEPDVFSIRDLASSPKKTTCWDGVRNYQARNFIRDDMAVGDQVLIYHSNSKPPGIAGLAEIVKSAYPDHTAFDDKDPHFDPKSNPESPRWFMVDVKLVEIFESELSLPLLREQKALAKMELLRKGSRLSVQPVSKQEFNAVLKLSKKAAKS